MKDKFQKKKILAAAASTGIVLAAGIGLYSLNEQAVNKKRQEVLIQKLQTRREFLENTESLKTKHPDLPAWRILIERAENENADSYYNLENLVGKNIPEARFETIEDLSPEKDGQELYEILKNSDGMDPKLLTLLADEPDALEYVKSWPKRASLANPPVKLEEPLDEIPSLLQWDLRWGWVEMEESWIGLCGDGPVCMSMAVSYLNQDPSITPAVMSEFALKNHDFDSVNKTCDAFLYHAAQAYGLSLELIPVSEYSIDQAMNEGKVLIASLFARTLHEEPSFILIKNLTDSGYEIADPASKINSETVFDPYELTMQIRAVWGLSRNPVS